VPSTEGTLVVDGKVCPAVEVSAYPALWKLLYARRKVLEFPAADGGAAVGEFLHGYRRAPASSSIMTVASNWTTLSGLVK